MNMRTLPTWALALLLVLIIGGAALAQEDSITVPDLTGLNVPRAAAELNRLGLKMGTVTPQQWTAASPQAVGTIATQGIAAGQPAARGDTVDLSVLTDARIQLIYDDNDLTLVNATGRQLNMRQLVFGSTDGTKRFMATRWRPALPAGDCAQVWAVSRFDAKETPGCDSIFWMTTNNSAEHFWTQASGAAAFNIVLNGESVATCDAAPPSSQDAPLTCEFFILTPAVANPVTGYVYFAYTTDRFAVINKSDERWMPLGNTPVRIAGLELNLGAPALFGNPDIAANVARLAPGQCTLFTNGTLAEATPPEPCDLIAQAALEPARAFWNAAFDVVSTTRPDEQFTCPAATADRVTICVMPR